MLVSRILSFGLLKYQHRLIISYSRCFLSNISHASSSSEIKLDEKTENFNKNDNQKQSILTTKQIDDNNEWLWAYLRDRKTFSDLSEEQRRRVVEIG
jgi:hypothetical protein